MATGLQVRLLAALARPGGVACVGGSALFPRGSQGLQVEEGFSSYSGGQALPLTLISA